VQSAHEAEINNLKKSYAAEKANLEDRFESSIQAEKGEHYDHLRNLKQQMNGEERRLKQTSDKVVGQKKDTYKHEEIAAEQDGKSRVAQAIQKYAAAEDFERNRAIKAQTEVMTDHKNNAEHIINDSQMRLQKLAEDKTNYLEQQKESHALALNEIQAHYQAARNLTTTQYASEAEAITARAAQDLNDKRLANASVMKTFGEKQADPFYQLKRFESDLLDIGNAYMLRVKVPEYERKQFKVQVASQEIQLKGVRSSDETAQLEPGREVSTRSFQNIAERYSLDAPVDGRSMTYQEKGEWLEYTIPKLGAHHRVSDEYRKPANMTDTPIAQELNFKNTLPTPDATIARGNKPISG
jgi:HSP20 family molecular chaperone IbpA